MTAALTAFGTVSEILRVVLLWAALFVAAVATVDWLVRTRRINPFGPLARFFRKHVDPWMEPVERRVIRAGGLPANAPWWALAAVVVLGLLLIVLLDFVGVLFADLYRGMAGGAGGMTRLLVYWAFTFLRIAIMVRVLASWLPIGPYSPWIRWSFTVSEPILRPLRRLIPPIRSIDITPIVAFFGLSILENVVRGWLG